MAKGRLYTFFPILVITGKVFGLWRKTTWAQAYLESTNYKITRFNLAVCDQFYLIMANATLKTGKCLVVFNSLFTRAGFSRLYSIKAKLDDGEKFGPLDALYEKIDKKELLEDKVQLEICKALQNVYDNIEKHTNLREEGFFNRLFASKPAVPKGLYIYGAVGGGKTMLMDMFYR